MAQDHAILLGKLLGNLQSLETVLRLYLLNAGRDFTGPQQARVDYWKLAKGNEVPEDAFTNFDALSTLIAKYNAAVQATDPNLQVDVAVVELRDLLAHGRVSADRQDEARLAILKFDKPVGGQVRVVAAALMTDKWFAHNIAFVHEQIRRVAAAMAGHAV